jgi:hypothetical protein
MMDINILLPQYGELNRIFQNTVEKKDISFDNQCFITDFQCKFSGLQEFDTMLANLVIELVPEKFSILIKKLHTEINKNLECYSQNKIFFDSINIENKVNTYANKYDYLIEVQTKIVSEIRKDYNVVNGDLDSIGYTEHTNQELEVLWKEHAYHKSILEPEVLKLKDLWKSKQELEIIAFTYMNNVFGKVYELSNSLILILDIYLQITIDEGKQVYFDLELIGKLYKYCNGELFEEISEINFYLNFNLLSCQKELEYKTCNKLKICHLIKIIARESKIEDIKIWKVEFLKKLNLTNEFHHKSAEISNIINPDSPKTKNKKYNDYVKFDSGLKILIK